MMSIGGKGRIFTGQMPFLLLNQQLQGTEKKKKKMKMFRENRVDIKLITNQL